MSNQITNILLAAGIVFSVITFLVTIAVLFVHATEKIDRQDRQANENWRNK